MENGLRDIKNGLKRRGTNCPTSLSIGATTPEDICNKLIT